MSRIKEYPSITSFDGTTDALAIEQTDGANNRTRKVSPAQIKQYVLGSSIDDIYSVMGQNGAKNLIPYPYYESSYTENGITWTVNADGTITADGTAEANEVFVISYNFKDLIKEGTDLILSGCPSGGSASTYKVGVDKYVAPSFSSVANDFGSGEQFKMPTDGTRVRAFITIYNGTEVSNLVFKPMLRLASDTDNTYQPYAKTNKELTDAIGDLSQTGLTGESVADQLGDASEQISAITNLIDVQSVNVAYPGSGTDAEKVKSIATGVYSAITLKRHFTIVNVNDENGDYRGEMVISELSSNYSVGLYLGYYTNLLYRVKNTGGTITVARIAEA